MQKVAFTFVYVIFYVTLCTFFQLINNLWQHLKIARKQIFSIYFILINQTNRVLKNDFK